MAKKMKLCFNINAFDATECLEPILSELREDIDCINALYQKQSYWNNPMNPEDFEELQRLKSIGLIDNLIEFKPDFSKYSREQECEKRNMGILWARQNGYNYVMSTDADEAYNKEQFRWSKQFILDNNYTNTYCSYINYYRDLDHYLKYPFKPYVPYIHSTFYTYTYNGPGPNTSLGPGPTDPTRRINNPLNIGTYVFEDGNQVLMHHLAWIRKDIRKKLINWSAKDNFPDTLIDECVKRWNNWKEGDDAIMLFNVKDNSVKTNKLDKRYCTLNIPWLEEQVKQWKEKNNYK